MPTGFVVLSEIPEATSAILENRVITALSKYQQFIDYIHISDQFSGPIQQDETTSLKQPETKPVLMAGFNLPKDGDMEAVKPLLILIFYLMERLKVLRISKEESKYSYSQFYSISVQLIPFYSYVHSFVMKTFNFYELLKTLALGLQFTSPE